MSKEHTLYMKRDGGELKDSLSDFGFAVLSCPWPDVETVDVVSREWPGDDGEDAYVPPAGLSLKAYDLSVEFCYKGNDAVGAYRTFRDWLRGGMLTVYDSYWDKGCKGTYMKKISGIEPHRDNTGEYLRVTVAFRVTDPVTDIVAAVDDDGEIYNIGAV